jgi:hypothetical protein
MPAVYVGQTDNPVEQRLQEHLVRYHSGLCIHHHFIGLLPLISDRYNPIPHGETVLEVEAALAEVLHWTGCSVFGAH